MPSAAAKPLRTVELVKQGTGKLVVNWKDRESYLKRGYEFVNNADFHEHDAAAAKMAEAQKIAAAVKPIPGDPITDPNVQKPAEGGSAAPSAPSAPSADKPKSEENQKPKGE